MIYIFEFIVNKVYDILFVKIKDATPDRPPDVTEDTIQFTERDSRVETAIATTIGMPYTLSFKIEVLSGNANLDVITYSNNGTHPFFTEVDFTGLQEYSITTTAEDTFLVVGIRDHNTSGYGNIRFYDIQLSANPYAMPPIPTNGTTVSSPVEYATATTGSKFSLAGMPKALSSFNGAPSRLNLVVYNGYELHDTGQNKGLLSCIDAVYSLSYTDYKKPFKSTDGVTSLINLVPSNAKAKHEVMLLWGDYQGQQKMQLVVNGIASDIASFDGSWTPDSFLNFFWNNPELWYLRKLTIQPLKDSDWVVS